MKKENYDSMVAFTEPLFLPGETKLVYGIAFTLGNRDAKELAQNIERYIKYLTAVCRWYKDGGRIDNDLDIWYDVNSNAYHYDSDEYLRDYQDKAYVEGPIRYNVRFGNIKFNEKDLDDDLIIRQQ